jgi:hypothetical protein
MTEFAHDPLGHVKHVYPWTTGILEGIEGPRVWQREILELIGAHLANEATRFTPLRIAVASGHGIGKSALIAMIVKWGLDSCVDTRIVFTAAKENQLLTKTMPEIVKWHLLSRSAPAFRPTASALISTAKGHDKSWRADAETWSIANTEAFAGLHNKGRRIVMIYDEASGIIPQVWEVTLGALTDEDTEIIWLAFGNPTQNTGPFRECFGRRRALWHTRQIDSRDVEGTNKAYLDELVRTYGEDSDVVKVRVRGQFPSASSLQFIPSGVVEAARTREVEVLPTDPLVYGVDIARFGSDHSTLAKRCGRDARSRPWRRWHGADTMRVAGEIAGIAQDERPDAIFVDGGAMGAGVVDRLRQLNIENVFEVNFGSAGRDAIWAGDTRVRTANRRAEMWTNMRAWLERGAIPDEQVVEDDLTGVEYGYNADQAVLLEKKEHMLARGLASPDDADALALTFAEPVAPRPLPGWLDRRRAPAEETYDRFNELGSAGGRHP